MSSMKGYKYKINFLTAAVGKYKMFVYPYIASILTNVEESHVEVVVDDLSYFSNTLDQAKDIFKDRFLIREYGDAFRGWEKNPNNWSQANTIRFLTEPQVESQHVYIGDVDIIILNSDIVNKHLEHAKLINLPYSNIKRNGINNLSGLHFIVDAKSYYNYFSNGAFNLIIKAINDNACPYYDEQLLFYMMNETHGVPKQASIECTFPNAEPSEVIYDYRPQHGLHLSLNRSDITHPTKGWGFSPNRNNKYRVLSNSDLWKASSKLFSEEYNQILSRVEKVVFKK